MTEEERSCILDGKKRGGCASCSDICSYRIALHGLNGKGGRVASAGIPKDYRYITLDNSPVRSSQEGTYKALDAYAKTFGKKTADKSLYLWSESPGTGKTSTAVALLNEYISRIYLTDLKEGRHSPQVIGVFFDVNEFQTEYNLATMTRDDAAMAEIKAKILRVQDAPFAVIDDVGVRSSTEAFRAYVHAIVNHRVTNEMPTIYTSNLPITEMAKVFDGRLYDRIRDNCGVIHFDGVSNRGRR